jgi:hypothetical protein
VCTDDACVAGSCQHTNNTNACDDGNACTTDSCDPAIGCVHTPVPCYDGNACTTYTCDPATGCVYGSVSCDDGDACTTDSCDPATGCGHACNATGSSDPCCADPGCAGTPICETTPPWGTPASTIGIGQKDKAFSDIVNYLLLLMVPLGTIPLYGGLRRKK